MPLSSYSHKHSDKVSTCGKSQCVFCDSFCVASENRETTALFSRVLQPTAFHCEVPSVQLKERYKNLLQGRI